MGIIELGCYQHLASCFFPSPSLNYKFPAAVFSSAHLNFKGSTLGSSTNFKKKSRAVGATTTSQEPPTESTSESETPTSDEPPAINLAFVSSVLLPDGSPDVRFRTAAGGQKLRNIMLDANVELYGPYARPLLNCGGGGTCGTCIVEVVQGKELLNRRTDKEKEKLKKNPKNWRLACQTTVGTPDSTGLLVIQQLPEWKLHDWSYGEQPPPVQEQDS